MLKLQEIFVHQKVVIEKVSRAAPVLPPPPRDCSAAASRGASPGQTAAEPRPGERLSSKRRRATRHMRKDGSSSDFGQRRGGGRRGQRAGRSFSGVLSRPLAPLLPAPPPQGNALTPLPPLPRQWHQGKDMPAGAAAAASPGQRLAGWRGRRRGRLQLIIAGGGGVAESGACPPKTHQGGVGARAQGHHKLLGGLSSPLPLGRQGEGPGPRSLPPEGGQRNWSSLKTLW